jgi:glycosyltransferase involved in cell wall biosynthesis
MRLSVIVPCYNAEPTIDLQLQALANQSWTESWEIIIADNGSTDRTVELAESYREKLPNLRIVDASGKSGAAYAKNCGVNASTGEALLFCDADDEVSPEWVSRMGCALLEHNFVASGLEYEKLNTPWTLRSRRKSQKNGLQSYNRPPYLPHAAGCSLGVKRSIYDAVGGFDESFSPLDDTDFCWKVQLSGTKLHFVPDAVVHYRFRDNLKGIYNQARSYAKADVFLYKKYQQFGMPQLSWKAGLIDWLRLLKRSPNFLNEETRVRWIRELGWSIGHLEGSISYRITSASTELKQKVQ